MDQVSLLWLMYGSAWLLCFIIGLLILWVVIRAAVLSALRKHRRELWEEEHGRS